MSTHGETPDCVFKVILAGNPGVGKTSIFRRYTTGTFFKDTVSTVGADYSEYTEVCGKRRAKLALWDTAGQEKFRCIVQTYYRASQAMIVVYDVTDRKSFKDVPYWLNTMVEQANGGVVACLVGNKIDLKEDRKVSREEALECAKSNNLLFMETSALEGINVNDLFKSLAVELVKHYSTDNGTDVHPDITTCNTVEEYQSEYDRRKRKRREKNKTDYNASMRNVDEMEEEEEREEEEEGLDVKNFVYSGYAIPNTYDKTDAKGFRIDGEGKEEKTPEEDGCASC